MSVSSAISAMEKEGFTPEQILAVVKSMLQTEEAKAQQAHNAQPLRTARQERNRRYYEKRASEKRLNASETSYSDALPPSSLSSPDGFPPYPLSLTPTNTPTPSKNPPKGGQKGSPTRNVYPEQFEVFWKQYPPNGAAKAEAFKSWEKAVKNGTDGNEIIGAVAGYAAYCDATGTPICHATTWLNQQRWTVDHDALSAQQRNGNQPRRDSGAAPQGPGKSGWITEAERLDAKYRAQDG